MLEVGGKFTNSGSQGSLDVLMDSAVDRVNDVGTQTIGDTEGDVNGVAEVEVGEVVEAWVLV